MCWNYEGIILSKTMIRPIFIDYFLRRIEKDNCFGINKLCLSMLSALSLDEKNEIKRQEFIFGYFINSCS